jgi:hypothetical protein
MSSTSKIPQRLRGLNSHRLKSNPDEMVMAKELVRFIEEGQAMPERRPDALDYLLDSGQGSHPKLATDRDRQVACTVIQWLGSPVGKSFITEAIEKMESR